MICLIKEDISFILTDLIRRYTNHILQFYNPWWQTLYYTPIRSDQYNESINEE